MAKADFFEIEIVSWEEHNPKEKRKNKRCSWFRVESRMTRSPKYLSLSAGAKLLWLAVLSEASDGDHGKLRVLPGVIYKACNVRPGSISGALQELESICWIRILAAPPSRARDTKRTKRTKRNETSPSGGAQLSLPTPSAPAPVGLIAVYCERWKARYGTHPPINGKVAGQLKRMEGDLGKSRAEKMIEAYLQMPDSWFMTKRHDVSTLLANLNAVAQFLDTGSMISKTETRQIDSAIANKNTLDALRRGEI